MLYLDYHSTESIREGPEINDDVWGINKDKNGVVKFNLGVNFFCGPVDEVFKKIKKLTKDLVDCEIEISQCYGELEDVYIIGRKK